MMIPYFNPAVLKNMEYMFWKNRFSSRKAGEKFFHLPLGNCRHKKIHNRIRILAGFDLGTQCTLATECGLGRRNIQFPGILGLFSEPKISWFNFFVDWKV
jgi:hypothetical protein